MDEPFGALDPITRDTLQDLVKELQQKLGKTFIFVTHDMDEAIKLADKICIMSKGQVVQYDTPDNILRNPANDFVKDFIGQNRLIQDRPNMKTVEGAMIKPVTVHADDSLNDAVNVMRQRRVDTIFVVNNHNTLLGFLDIEDINQGLRTGKELIDTMQRDVYKVHIDSKLQDSVRTILKRNVRNVPVVDDHNQLIGLITRANLVDIVYDSIWGEDESETTKAETSSENGSHNRVQQEQEENIAQESELQHKGANEPDDTQKTELINNGCILP